MTGPNWPLVDYETERIWRPTGRRVPIADRGVRYRPAIPPTIATADPWLSSATHVVVEEATLRLRSVDAAGSTGPATVALLRSESAASSKIEQIDVAQRYIGRALAGLPTRQRSAREVAANVAALRLALDHVSDTADSTFFDLVHATLLPDERWAGQLRTVQNWIGGSDHSPRHARFVPPVPERLPELMADLAAFVVRDDLPALVQAAVAHAQFETVHPYVDGNGRVGRALAHVVLRRRDVVVNGVAPLSVVILADRARYFDDLRAYERGEVDGVVARFARAGILAADAAERLAHQLARLRGEWRELPAVADTRADATVRRVVEDLVDHPVCDARQVADRHGVSPEAARTALERLVRAGVLNRTTAARNLHVFEAPEVFAAIEDLEPWAAGVGMSGVTRLEQREVPTGPAITTTSGVRSLVGCGLRGTFAKAFITMITLERGGRAPWLLRKAGVRPTVPTAVSRRTWRQVPNQGTLVRRRPSRSPGALNARFGTRPHR